MKYSQFDNIDSASGVFNQRYMAILLETYLAKRDRYGLGFSLIVVETPQGDGSGQQIKDLGDFIKLTVRSVDDAARLDDGRFVILLPHTPQDGAGIVVDRLRGGVARLYPQAAGDPVVTALSSDFNNEELLELRNELLAASPTE